MAKTEVILTHNVIGLGAESDQVKVAAGYARNYLFPQGLAIPLSGANKRRLEALRQRRAEREAHDLNAMTELSKSISKLVCVISVKTGDDGKMFGTVTSGMIAPRNADADLNVQKGRSAPTVQPKSPNAPISPAQKWSTSRAPRIRLRGPSESHGSNHPPRSAFTNPAAFVLPDACIACRMQC